MVDVPFGAAQVVTSLVQGEVDSAVQLPAALAEYVKLGQLRLLASLTANRDPAFPDTPTAREQGVDVALEAWRGIAVPKGTPKPVIAVLEAAVRQTVESPEFGRASTPLGVRPAYLPADAFGTRIAREDAELAKLIELIGLKKS
jgi:tripartite-type tricarboxylate transporter receptor subunit TctC